MTIDWTKLNEKVQNWNSIVTAHDKACAIGEIIATGLCFRLSDLMEQMPAHGGSILCVYADTLIIDRLQFGSTGVVIVARCIDVSALGGLPLLIPAPKTRDTAIIQILYGQVIGGALQFAFGVDGKKETLFSPPPGLDSLCASLMTLSASGAVTTVTVEDAESIADLTGHGLALNSLRASFAAATYLIDAPNDEARANGVAMLRWIVACTRSAGSVVPTDFAELFNQAAALLVDAEVSIAAHFVPVLSNEFYSRQVSVLVSALASYEVKLRSLETADDIKKAIADIGGTLNVVTQDEAGPLAVDQRSISDNIKGLRDNIDELIVQFDLQAIQSGLLLTTLKSKAEDQKIRQFLDGVFNSVVATVKSGVNAVKIYGGDASAIGDVLSQLVAAVKSGKAAISAYKAPALEDRNLMSQAVQIMTIQEQIAIAFQTGAKVWSDAERGATNDLPRTLLSAKIDPDLAWKNYIVGAEAWFANLLRTIGDGTGSDPVKEAATNYLASLKILANYGHSINAMMATMAGQMARGAVVTTQIDAAKQAARRWQELAARSKDDSERLALLKSLVQSRMDAVKRSIFTAWRYYRESYYYLYFTQPLVTMTLDMDAATIKDAFAQVQQWVARLLGDAPSSEQIRLPNNEVDIVFRFPVVKATVGPTTMESALLTPEASGTKAMLTWTIPVETMQLKGVIRNWNTAAIWIKKASFILEGAEPNDQGNLIATVSTSGSYVNGYGPAKASRFVTKAMSGDFAYRPKTGEVYIPWQVEGEIYMTPSPYTQWKLMVEEGNGDLNAVTSLTMKLTVAYRSK